ncbi:UDP-N-acetylmuramoyl-tripeptide--D-alanyl-D-alanine ligase [Polynucleobacter sp. AP-Nino-20-G2]|uniref:UDP-N-acetylmuramoyl-tripeptide--D-alanyl-D- alanine ligase n=1 Tax=Polynucleobacter sp. AP-Nino-20-G2 TaxID=2576917 RepID=UPI001BFDDEE8|nr:UDP-N-acetylmuramoyl-tripeptide--D-alanyl-D-alanine ligase [Polynucleobacter sp. AP-Nino-20-G2]QWE16812.1 UDP-N-acetylmuramoyl-tripeptide--D-alanyl-D-alanine ligase [Polynucleobacter sp. AP-Nino-20-G2]
MSMMTTLAQAHAMLPGSVLLNISEEDAKSLSLSKVGTDSRQIEQGELFVALIGERFDAHDFLLDVAQSGAAAILISKQDVCPKDFPALCVADTKVALGKLAQAWRATFSIPVAVVTGSNGKTTVKEMIASIFKAAVGEANTLVTKGNFNNDIGLPLTLLRLRPSDRLAVIELGMNHPGETAQLAVIAQPTIALINNAQREHQEFMATVEAVAKEHATVLGALPLNGVAVFPADSEFSELWRQAATGRKMIDFSLSSHVDHKGAAVSGRLLENGKLNIQAEQGEVEVRLNTLGNHNIRNALAASAVALGAGLSLENIKEGLQSFSPVNGRMQAKQVSPHITLIDDSYNANPDSVRAAIDALHQSGNLSWLVLGDMGEVGDQGPAFHQEVGAYAAERGIAKLFALGEQCEFAVHGFNAVKKQQDQSSVALHFLELDLLLAELSGVLGDQASHAPTHLDILVKGSRFMRMERVVQALLKEAKTCS